MASINFFRFEPSFQIFKNPVIWTVDAGDTYNYWSLAAAPFQANSTAVTSSTSGNTDNNMNFTMAIEVTLYDNKPPGGTGALIRLTAIGVHA